MLCPRLSQRRCGRGETVVTVREGRAATPPGHPGPHAHREGTRGTRAVTQVACEDVRAPGSAARGRVPEPQGHGGQR